MISNVILVTPDMAAEYLTHNTANRPFRASRVQQFVTKLKAGKWRVTHHGIGFDVNGVLLDGQHRLLAIQQSGIAAECMVTHGLDPETFMDLDASASVRVGSDLLAIEGRRRGVEISSVVQTYAVARMMLSGLTGSHPAPPEVIARAFESRSVIASCVGTLRGADGVTAPVMAAVAKACEFFESEQPRVVSQRLRDELWDGLGDPMKILNRTLRGASGAAVEGRRAQSWRRHLSARDRYGITVQALRLALDHKTARRIDGTDYDWGEPFKSGDRSWDYKTKIALRVEAEAEASSNG